MKIHEGPIRYAKGAVLGHQSKGENLRWRKGILRKDPCAYCGKCKPRKRTTIDHIVPRSRGGSDGTFNLTGSCIFCNRTKGHEPMLLYLLWGAW